MTFTLKIRCNNEAFTTDPFEEIGWILEKAAKRIRLGLGEGQARLVDRNGNTVGQYRLEEDGS